MSDITNVVLWTACGEGRNDDHTVDFVNAEVNKTAPADGRWKLTRVDGHTFGPKAMEVDVWAGGFNYLELDVLLDALSEAAWAYPEEVVLLVQKQWEDFPTFYMPGVHGTRPMMLAPAEEIYP